MIFCWVLIACAFLNVLADYNKYIQYVERTNAFIECACKKRISKTFYNGFDIAIKNIVRGNKYTFEEMNYMLATPDYAEDNPNLQKIMRYQGTMRNEIIDITGYCRFPSKRRETSTRPEAYRRTATTKAIRGLFALDLLRGNDVNYTNDQKCILIGLAVQSKYISKYTETANFENGFCVIKDSEGNVKKYKEIENEFWEVDCDQVDLAKEKLLDQLKH
ncbi:uncharacterized protein LOC126835535 [Adelges cooleyi]|uniref:uncharacterized protein LOC126835535 n=1 Tax=Adelges cooleyi TaxID=133065 RepID=UPI0021808F55|nr:uncharacterized protein LOC126835535 [Adelges cooleyi]XP_050424153.1 uncharacterized protein LOC126835535 [Adelges cooleyi]